jgi:hypothetical protein
VTSSKAPLTDRELARLEARLEPEYELLRQLEQGGLRLPVPDHRSKGLGEREKGGT